jgi:hypothetical protein
MYLIFTVTLFFFLGGGSVTESPQAFETSALKRKMCHPITFLDSFAGRCLLDKVTYAPRDLFARGGSHHTCQRRKTWIVQCRDTVCHKIHANRT